MAKEYGESAIKILEGLEPVKLRPGQFTRTDSPLHIVQEVLDNAVDEAIAGYATKIEIRLLPDGKVSVEDNGRGIPVGKHPEKGIPVIQAIFTILYSGGKFDKTSGGAYTYAGGLHGVGVSVTNALSSSLRAEVKRDGWWWAIEFADGEVVKPLTKLGKAEGTGTRVVVQPNPKYFDSAEIPVKELRELAKSKAVLLPGLEVRLIDERHPDNVKEEVFVYQNGLSSLLSEIAGEGALTPIVTGEAYAQADDTAFADGEGASWAFAWFEGGDGSGRSFVNLIPTPQHGTHVSGLRSAVFNAVRQYIEHHSMMPKGLKLAADDVFKCIRFVLSVKLLDPAFDNQTKDRLSSRDAVRLLERMVQPQVEAWLNLNPSAAKTVADMVIRIAQARQRSANKVERKRSSSVVLLPGKLADCESDNPQFTELFLVEGDSAGGSAKQARSKEFQAILPLRGKSLNVWEKTADEALSNEEIHDIATAIGLQPHKLTDSVDFGRLRYGKICILADADVDGFHIQTLLLTLFFRHFPQLIERGHVYVARPPLYRIDTESQGKKRPARKVYVMDEAELHQWQERLKKEGYKNLTVGRFKGLGEMDPPELWETTLCPDTRRLLKVQLPEALREEAIQTFDNLMNKNKAGWRRDWMERRGNEVEAF
jgi:topoisomerase-4 subunit B